MAIRNLQNHLRLQILKKKNSCEISYGFENSRCPEMCGKVTFHNLAKYQNDSDSDKDKACRNPYFERILNPNTWDRLVNFNRHWGCTCKYDRDTPGNCVVNDSRVWWFEMWLYPRKKCIRICFELSISFNHNRIKDKNKCKNPWWNVWRPRD